MNFKADLTCGTLIAKLNEWQEKGFVTKGVWDKIRELLGFEIPVISTSDESSGQKGNAMTNGDYLEHYIQFTDIKSERNPVSKKLGIFEFLEFLKVVAYDSTVFMDFQAVGADFLYTGYMECKKVVGYKKAFF